jgi:polygalacturonase
MPAALLVQLLLLLSSVAAQQVFDVVAFGAVGDGLTLDTTAIRNATKALAAAGGGELRFAAGRTFLTEPFNLSSHTLLTLGANTTIRGHNASGPEWPLLTVFDVWPWFGQARDALAGTESARLMHQPIIFAWHETNISVVSGEGGTLDGQGAAWWSCAALKPGPGNLSQAPCSGYSRPQNLFFSNVSGVRIINLTTWNPPDWNVHLGYCDDVYVSGLSAHSLPSTALHPVRKKHLFAMPCICNDQRSLYQDRLGTNVGEVDCKGRFPQDGDEPNADGIDLDACQRVLVENSYFSVTDDAICVKSGLDWYGRTYGRPTRDVLVRNCEIAAGAGPTIGSEMSGGVRNVTFEVRRKDTLTLFLRTTV